MAKAGQETPVTKLVDDVVEFVGDISREEFAMARSELGELVRKPSELF